MESLNNAELVEFLMEHKLSEEGIESLKGVISYYIVLRF